MKKHLRITDITLPAVFAALMCILAPLSVPVGAVPVSLATFCVYIAVQTLGAKRGGAAVLCYVAIGAAGLPVFSGFTGGAAWIAGMTGGFIVGYIPCALICGFLAGRVIECRFKNHIVNTALLTIPALCGAIACYICGISWYMIMSGSGIVGAVTVCVLPFILPELLKIVCASAVAYILRLRLASLSQKNK